LKKSTFTIFAVIGLTGIMLIASILVTIPIQPSYSSSGQQADDEQQTDEAQQTEEVPQEDVPASDEQQEPQAAEEQQPPTVTQPPTDTEPIGTNQSVPSGTTNQSGGGPVTEREICVTNANGQKFCYKELTPDEVCLKPMNADDPPFCPTKSESISNQTTGTGSPTNPGILNETRTVNATNYTSEATSSGGEAGEPIPDIDVKLGGKPDCKREPTHPKCP
jgi:hypothetical protein